MEGCPLTYLPPNVQGRQETRRTKEEEKRDKGLNNLFGAVVDNYKLDKMARYMGKPKTYEDRGREALILANDDDNYGKAFHYVYSLVPSLGNPLGTICLIYNATGDTLYQVDNHDWYGHMGRAPYSTEIDNGQWAAFRHAYSLSEGSIAAVVYRGKNKDGEDQDYLLAWSAPLAFYIRNKSYCEIGGVAAFQKHWPTLIKNVMGSDYCSNAKSDGHEIGTKICTGPSPTFTAIISCR
ncbi:hypothetical protein ACQ4PT_042876 [Festuca glaucescens]